jgi:hypothetical protein
MSRTTRSGLLAVLLTALALLGGCTTTVTGTPSADPAPAPTQGPGSDPVAWVDKVCGGVLAFATPAIAPPNFGTSTDLPALKTAFSTYLGTVVTGAQKGGEQLAAVGRSPVAGGDDVLAKARATMTKLRNDFAGAKATVDGANPNDPQAFVAALDKVQSTLSSVTAPDALSGIVALPRLGAAAQRSDQCRKLATLATTAPR